MRVVVIDLDEVDPDHLEELAALIRARRRARAGAEAESYWQALEAEVTERADPATSEALGRLVEE